MTAKAEEQVGEIQRQVEGDASAMLENEIEETVLNRLAEEDEELADKVRKRLSTS